MQESHSIESWLPLWHVGDVKLILRDTRVSPLQTRLHALWRFICEFDGGL